DITVIPCCVDNKRFDRDSGSAGMLREKYKLSGKFVFLYIGSVGTWYLLDEMLDFFIAARNAIRSAHFLVLTHIDQEMVRRACERKHISPDEVTVSCAPFQEMPAHIAMADAGIFFIKPCFSKRSSCPTKYAEYLACGLPVVINAGIGDTDTIVRDRGLGVVVDGFDKSHYDAAVHQLVGLMKDSPAISARCRRAAQELFSLEDGVNKYFNVYRSLPCN
ncbi:MAG: glycosyltransferase, partial [Candidatus Omnitrophota bacterium]